MANIQPQFQRDFSSGMITNISPRLKPENSVKLGMNVDFDEDIGAAVSRLGTAIVNQQLENGKAILGLHNFRDTASTDHALLAVVNNSGDTNSVVTDVENDTVITGGSKWNALTASAKARFLTYLDTVLLVNGTSTNAPSQWSGSGNVTTTGGTFDLGNLPISDPDYVIEFLDRVYLAKEGDDTLFYSSVPSSGSISWTSGNGNVEIEPEDGGGGIKGFGKVPNYLLIFKERSMKRWNFQSAFPESLVQIGTPSQESVVMGGGQCAFFSASDETSKGFYVTRGDRPVPISHNRVRNIKKWVDAIGASNYANVAGWATDTHFAWSVGDVTVDGTDYTNVVLRWNRIFDQWSVRSYPSEFKVFSKFVTSSKNVVVGGDDDGNVIELDKADTFTDYPSSAPIHWEVLLQDEDFKFNQQKAIDDILVVRGRDIEEARVEVHADDKQENFGGVHGRVSKIPLGKTLQGTDFNIGIKGTNKGIRAKLHEIEVPKVTVLQDYGN